MLTFLKLTTVIIGPDSRWKPHARGPVAGQNIESFRCRRAKGVTCKSPAMRAFSFLLTAHDAGHVHIHWCCYVGQRQGHVCQVAQSPSGIIGRCDIGCQSIVSAAV